MRKRHNIFLVFFSLFYSKYTETLEREGEKRKQGVKRKKSMEKETKKDGKK